MCLISESSHWIRNGGAVLVPNEVGFRMRGSCVLLQYSADKVDSDRLKVRFEESGKEKVICMYVMAVSILQWRVF